MARRAAFIHSAELERYKYPDSCPFNVSRAGKTLRILESMDLLGGEDVSVVAPEAAGRVVLKKFHTSKYLHTLQTAANGKYLPEALNMGIGTGDCPVFPDMYDYSAHACGASLKGVELIVSGEAQVAFNPSGGLHHAGPERASGFCYLNDVVLACMALAEEGKKVLYLDVDVHHGDGVAYAFYDRADVMTISLHQNGRTLFPGTGFANEVGTGRGRGYCVNIPLPIGTYDEAYLEAFSSIALPLIEAYGADVFVFELGVDALAGDPLANLRLTNNVYVEIIEHLLRFEKPILMTGGGGYQLGNTVRAWALGWTVLSGTASEDDAFLAVGGVMLESEEWQGGLRDRKLPAEAQQRQSITAAIEAVAEVIKAEIFPVHGL